MFITTLAEYLNGYDVNITIRKNDDGSITTIIVPKPRSDKKNESPLAPVSCTASPEFYDSPEFLDQFKPLLTVTREKITNINMYTDAIEKLEKKKKEDAEKKSKPASTSKEPKSKNPGATVTTTTKKQVPNPDFIPEDERNDENPDYDPETYDEDTPEFIEEEVKEQVPIQKTLI